jgi:hypothetical protein
MYDKGIDNGGVTPQEGRDVENELHFPAFAPDPTYPMHCRVAVKFPLTGSTNNSAVKLEIATGRTKATRKFLCDEVKLAFRTSCDVSAKMRMFARPAPERRRLSEHKAHNRIQNGALHEL